MFSNLSINLNSIHQCIANAEQMVAISEEQKLILQGQGNIFEKKTEIFSSSNEFDGIRNNFFSGEIFLIGESQIINSSLRNVFIDGPSIIRDCALIESSYIGANCNFIGNGPISGKDEKFGAGFSLVLCEETGGRKLRVNPETASIDLIDFAISTKIGQLKYNNETDFFLKRIFQKHFTMNVFKPNTVIMKCSLLNSIWTDGNTRIINSDISGCVLGSNSEITNSIVAHSIVGPNVSVSAFSVVENSVLSPHSKVGIHAKVVHSVIGSYSHLESGECVSSLIGPFVGLHHQSLCIATYWPKGRGNIGYGANVGSNHTGKAPDQELFAGEGVFFGLATIVKFPSNFTNAPYTLIASGVVCLPQTVEYPFSLINSTNVGGGLNEIIPGWMLSDNMFSLFRNEEKFQNRQKKDSPVESRIFRPDIISLIRIARDTLLTVGGKEIYTERDLPGVGKNILKEAARLKAIDTYSFIIRWYVLREIYLIHQSGRIINEEIKSLLKSENLQYSEKSVKSLLSEFAQLDQTMANSCVLSKSKDDVRGKKIIGPSYDEFHQPANAHPVCVGALAKASTVYETVQKLVAKL